jgi:dTDP-4-amino-4,6-dideoxygalactose transaminase
MIEMQAVIGRIQLRRMIEWTKIRTYNANVIYTALKPFSGVDGPIRLANFGCSINCFDGSTDAQVCGRACTHAHYKYYAYVRPQNLAQGWSRDRIIEAINKKGVPCYQGSCSEVYLEKAFDNSGWRPLIRLSIAKELGETSLMFLVHPTLTDQEMQKVCRVIQDVIKLAVENSHE